MGGERERERERERRKANLTVWCGGEQKGEREKRECEGMIRTYEFLNVDRV